MLDALRVALGRALRRLWGRQDTAIIPETGGCVALGGHIGLHVHGPTRDGIRLSGEGYTAGVDIEAGVMSHASATGIPSQNEDGTLDTCRILVRRLNQDGATWGDPVQVPPHIGGGVDCEALDTSDPASRFKIQVTRAEGDAAFWTQLHHEKQAELAPSTIDEVVARVWKAIWEKRFHARADEVLALNAIRTPWAIAPHVVDAFRQRYGREVRRIGFKEVWVVGWSEALTERLDT